MADNAHEVWLPVIGKCLAYACMHSAELHDKTIVEKARFLEALGLERKDVAVMLDTTPDSISVMFRRNKRRQGGAKNGKGSKGK